MDTNKLPTGEIAKKNKVKYPDYKSFVGPPEIYDFMGALQLSLLVLLGLREYHSILDIGCGSLRGGRFFITYLETGRYFGIDPEEWLIKEGIKRNLGNETFKRKKPVFSNDANFTLSVFMRKFDFILAQSIFSHASKKQISECLAEARKVMTSRSIFLATFREGEEDYQGDDWFYPGTIAYTWDSIRNLVEENQLVSCKLNWYHPTGQVWIVVIDPSKKMFLSLLQDNKLLLNSKKGYRKIDNIKERIEGTI